MSTRNENYKKHVQRIITTMLAEPQFGDDGVIYTDAPEGKKPVYVADRAMVLPYATQQSDDTHMVVNPYNGVAANTGWATVLCSRFSTKVNIALSAMLGHILDTATASKDAVSSSPVLVKLMAGIRSRLSTDNGHTLTKAHLSAFQEMFVKSAPWSKHMSRSWVSYGGYPKHGMLGTTNYTAVCRVSLPILELCLAQRHEDYEAIRTGGRLILNDNTTAGWNNLITALNGLKFDYRSLVLSVYKAVLPGVIDDSVTLSELAKNKDDILMDNGLCSGALASKHKAPAFAAIVESVYKTIKTIEPLLLACYEDDNVKGEITPKIKETFDVDSWMPEFGDASHYMAAGLLYTTPLSDHSDEPTKSTAAASQALMNAFRADAPPPPPPSAPAPAAHNRYAPPPPPPQTPQWGVPNEPWKPNPVTLRSAPPTPPTPPAMPPQTNPNGAWGNPQQTHMGWNPPVPQGQNIWGEPVARPQQFGGPQWDTPQQNDWLGSQSRGGFGNFGNGFAQPAQSTFGQNNRFGQSMFGRNERSFL